MNLIEKIYALLVDPNIRIWDYHHKPEKRFEYCFEGESHFFDNFQDMIEEAYACIDPLRKPLPKPEFPHG